MVLNCKVTVRAMKVVLWSLKNTLFIQCEKVNDSSSCLRTTISCLCKYILYVQRMNKTTTYNIVLKALRVGIWNKTVNNMLSVSQTFLIKLRLNTQQFFSHNHRWIKCALNYNHFTHTRLSIKTLRSKNITQTELFIVNNASLVLSVKK